MMQANAELRLAGVSEKAIPRKLSFSVKALAAIRCPAGKDRIMVWDTKTPGLCFVVTANDARSFWHIRKRHNRLMKMRLGGVHDISVEQARDMAMKANGEIALDKDPAAERAAFRKSATLGDVWDSWLENYAKIRLSTKSIVTDTSRYTTCLEQWANRSIAGITENDCRTLHATIAKTRGKVSANRALQLLRRLLNHAGAKSNPAAKAMSSKSTVKLLFTEHSRTRFLQPAELPEFFKALDDEQTDPMMRDFFKVCLFTAQRRGNVQSMRWDELDLVNGVWTVPATKAKAKKEIIVPLVPTALEIVKRRRDAAVADAKQRAVDAGEDPEKASPLPWVFASYGISGHLVESKAAWKSVLSRAKLENVTLHDLRRSMGSWQAIMGTSLPIIGASLGHANAAATSIYARLNTSPVRASLERAAAAMLGSANETTTATAEGGAK